MGPKGTSMTLPGCADSIPLSNTHLLLISSLTKKRRGDCGATLQISNSNFPVWRVHQRLGPSFTTAAISPPLTYPLWESAARSFSLPTHNFTDLRTTRSSNCSIGREDENCRHLLKEKLFYQLLFQSSRDEALNLSRDNQSHKTRQQSTLQEHCLPQCGNHTQYP